MLVVIGKISVGDWVLIRNEELKKHKKKPIGLARYKEPSKVISIVKGAAVIKPKGSSITKKVTLGELKKIPTGMNLFKVREKQ